MQLEEDKRKAEDSDRKTARELHVRHHSAPVPELPCQSSRPQRLYNRATRRCARGGAVTVVQGSRARESRGLCGWGSTVYGGTVKGKTVVPLNPES